MLTVYKEFEIVSEYHLSPQDAYTLAQHVTDRAVGIITHSMIENEPPLHRHADADGDEGAQADAP